MKKITCRNCGKKVNANAKRCPHCGTMLRLSTTSIMIIIAIVLLTIGFLAVGIIQSS